MELSSSNIKKFLTLSEEKAVHIFQETRSPKKFLIFQKTELSYISGSNFPSSKKRKKPTLKKRLIFQEMKLFSLKLKKLLIFQEELPKPQKPKFIALLQKKVMNKFFKKTLSDNSFHLFCKLNQTTLYY